MSLIDRNEEAKIIMVNRKRKKTLNALSELKGNSFREYCKTTALAVLSSIGHRTI